MSSNPAPPPVRNVRQHLAGELRFLGESPVDQHPGRTVTLFACHPPGSAEFRYVVFGELVTT